MAVVQPRIPPPLEAGVAVLRSLSELHGPDDLAAARGGRAGGPARRGRAMRRAADGSSPSSTTIPTRCTGPVPRATSPARRRSSTPAPVTCCCCSTPRCSDGCNRADTPTATATSREWRSGRPRRRPGIAGLRVLTPAIDLDVHVFHHATRAEPDHLHLDVRHLVVAPPGAVARGNEESEDSALARPRRASGR